MSVIEVEKCFVLPYGVCAACISRRLILPSCDTSRIHALNEMHSITCCDN